ncbi:MAG TPA: hypothetical protein VE029_05070, partial [Rhizobacter sp.]|nr:hypothetical protein [Rhizobacter sp.]
SLNASRIEASLRSAKSRTGRPGARPQYKVDARAAVADAPLNPQRAPATAPTVTVIKRRRIVMPPDGPTRNVA